MKKIKYKLAKNMSYLCLLFIIAFGLITIIGSGGGGGGGSGSSGDSTTQLGTIDSSTAPQVASAIMDIATGMDAALFPVTQDFGSGVYCPKTLLKHADDITFNGEKSAENPFLGDHSALHPAGYASETSGCTDDGSVTITMTWDGPDDPADCSDVQNLKMEFSFANCIESFEAFDGIMGMDFPGDSCTETPSSFSIYFNNLEYQNQIENSDFTLDFTMDYSGIQYDELGYIVGMNASTDGSMIGTFEGEYVNVNYNNLTLILNNIEYDGSNEIEKIVMTIDGSYNGTIGGDQFNLSFDELIFSYQQAIMDSVPGELFSIDGRFNGACLDGWITFETIEPMFLPESSQRPTSGQVKISGNGEATITFNSDGSVYINVDESQLIYTDVDSLPSCI